MKKKDAKQSLRSGFSPFLSLAIKRSCNKGFIFEAFQIYKINIYGKYGKVQGKKEQVDLKENPLETLKMVTEI